MFIIAVALAGVIGGWWLSRVPEIEHPAVGVKIARASPGTTGCAACHTEAIGVTDYTGCTGCHPEPPTIIGPLKGEIIFTRHHDVPPQPSCLDVACHDTDDARYVFRPVWTKKAEAHAYCEQCHDGIIAWGIPGNCSRCHL